MMSDTYKRIRVGVMFTEVIEVIFECFIFASCILAVYVNINILRVLIKHPSSTTPLEKCPEGDTCVVASPTRIQHYFGDHDSCSMQRTSRNGCLDRTTKRLWMAINGTDRRPDNRRNREEAEQRKQSSGVTAGQRRKD